MCWECFTWANSLFKLQLWSPYPAFPLLTANISSVAIAVAFNPGLPPGIWLQSSLSWLNELESTFLLRNLWKCRPKMYEEGKKRPKKMRHSSSAVSHSCIMDCWLITTLWRRGNVFICLMRRIRVNEKPSGPRQTKRKGFMAPKEKWGWLLTAYINMQSFRRRYNPEQGNTQGHNMAAHSRGMRVQHQSLRGES